eukprot:gb/GECG01015574.1/.p1 GENE.gb/GECG01015574.1/~~gb/GECG01015574.1/.p1  ORF type:complete len:140 (+),score=15.42 gb/GECG01015574.1/:1-420(+)
MVDTWYTSSQPSQVRNSKIVCRDMVSSFFLLWMNSEIFSTGWPHLTELKNVPTVQLGVSVEDASMIANLSQAVGTQKTHENRLEFARLVAKNLFRYLESFSQTTPEGERLVLPMSALERWLQRFEEKYRADPNFLSNQS